MRKITCLLYIFILMFVILSCKSVPNVKDDYICVMIYDYENNGIKEVELFIDDKKIGESDINGRFMIPIKKDKTKSSISLVKANYEKIVDEVQLTSGYVLYYKMGNDGYYFEKAQSLLDQKLIESALLSINKALEINLKDEYYFLKAIVLYRLGRKTDSLNCLNEIKSESIYKDKMEKLYEN